MKHWAAVLAGCVGAALAQPADAAPAGQPLSITIQGDGARATRLTQYDPAAPITITVTNSATRPVDAVTVAAAGPDGESVHVPLERTPGGSFSGSLSLGDRGEWELRFSSRSGPLSVDSSPVRLDVEPPPPSNAPAIGLAVGAAIFVFVGGGGFVALRRAAARRSPNQLDHAA